MTSTAPIISSNTPCHPHTTPTSPYQFTENPDTVTWNKQYYVYVERSGEFSETAGACWAQLNANIDIIKSQVNVEKYCSFYQYHITPKRYRAGVTVSAPPSTLPTDFHCIEYPGGMYARFILTGDITHLPVVCGRVDQRVKELSLHRDNDWQIEYYVTDPMKTKAEENIIEILVPIQLSNGKEMNEKTTCVTSTNTLSASDATSDSIIDKTSIQSTSTKPYQFTEQPDTIEWKSQYYVYVERFGEFSETARQCWGQLYAHVDIIKSQVNVEKYCSFYRYDTTPKQYRAGVTVSAPPSTLPTDFHCIEYPGGMYARFTMIGNFSHLPQVCGRVDQRVKELSLHKRNDYQIEYYKTDAKTTKADENIIEILVPIQSSDGKEVNDKTTIVSTTDTSSTATTTSKYQLTEQPDTIEWKSQYYVYVERHGPFQETARACWQQLHSHIAEIKSQVTVDKYCSFYRHDITPHIYRAGVTVSSLPTTLPTDFHSIEFPGGMYSRFILTGDYSHLPRACQRVEECVHELKLNIRKEGWYIENYVTDPHTTKSDENITEILVPIADK